MLFKMKISFFSIQYVLPPTPFNKETRADNNPWWLAMADRLVIYLLPIVTNVAKKCSFKDKLMAPTCAL